MIAVWMLLAVVGSTSVVWSQDFVCGWEGDPVPVEGTRGGSTAPYDPTKFQRNTQEVLILLGKFQGKTTGQW